jgi:heavy metal sensor kinase
MRIMTRYGQYESDAGGIVAAVIQVARSEAQTAQGLRDLLLILVLGLPLSVAIAGFGGYTLARRALATVDEITARARTITAERLHDRLPIANPDDEMGQLAMVFNDTLGRLEESFEQMRRFTGDVSHELRTPLTAIQSVGEVGLREPRDGPGYRAIIGSMLEEVDRLSRLVDRLLVLSRAETEAGKSQHEPIDLLALAREVVAHLEVLAEEKAETIAVEPGPALEVLGERLVLRQALINLVHNAIKFTPAGGRVVLRVSQLGEQVVMDITDTGPGIPPDAQPRLFDRFYRGAQDSEGGPDGTGLGLSIARRGIEANHGHLVLERTDPTGTTFRVSMPMYRKVTRIAS